MDRTQFVKLNKAKADAIPTARRIFHHSVAVLRSAVAVSSPLLLRKFRKTYVVYVKNPSRRS